MTPLRIATWNIRKAVGRDLRFNPARVLAAIADIDPDIIALQEADRRFGDHGALFDPDAIARVTGLRPVAFRTAHKGLGWHGNVLLVADRVHVADAAALALGGLEPRGAIRADLRAGGHDLRVVAAHLALAPPARRAQARDLADFAAGAGTTLIMGDFNAWQVRSRSLAPLWSTYEAVASGPTFPASWPLARLDRIYWQGAIRPGGGTVWTSGGAPRASDHLPLVVEATLGL